MSPPLAPSLMLALAIVLDERQHAILRPNLNKI
jgi:hypothetical protein